jgi:hypothetical protein
MGVISRVAASTVRRVVHVIVGLLGATVLCPLVLLVTFLAAEVPVIEVGDPEDPDDPQPRSDEERKPERKRGLGFTARKHRRRREMYLILRRLRRERPDMAEDERRALAERLVAEQVPEEGDDPVFDREYERLELAIRLPIARLTLTQVQLSCVLALAEMRWLVFEYLAGVDEHGKDREGGRPALRGRLVAGLALIAMARRKCDAKGVFEQLAAERNHTLAMTLRWPSGSQTSYPGFLRGLHSITRRKDPKVARALTVEFVRQLAMIPPRRGKHVVPYGVGVALAVDAMLVQANMAPMAPVADFDGQTSVNRSEHARESRGRKFRRARFLRVVVDGKVTFRATSWKWLQILELRTGRPLIGRLIESVGVEVERWAVIDLLRELFHWWSTCPAAYLVCDGLYASHWAGDGSFCEAIYRDFGLVLVAPAPAKDPSPDGKGKGRRNQKETLGVPYCSCGVLMELHGWENFYGPERRRREGIARGEAAPTTAKAAWNCARGRPGCKRKYTYMRDNWRVHTYLPYVGNHRFVKRRSALMLARNRIEGVFGLIKKLGLAGVAADRAEWAGDEDTEWLLALAALSLTARAVAHQNGLYKDMYAWYARLNVLTPVELDDETPEATPGQRREFLAWIEERLGPPAPPPMLRRDGKEARPAPLAGRSSALDVDLDVEPDLDEAA